MHPVPAEAEKNSKNAMGNFYNLKILIAQINTTVGEIQKNKEKIIQGIEKGKENNADIVVFPELTIPGYIPLDIILRKGFIEENTSALYDILPHTKGISIIIGYIDTKDNKAKANAYDPSSIAYLSGKKIFNTAAFIRNGEIKGKYYKQYPPSFDIYDEKRFFTSGKETPIFSYKGIKFSINICEDIWIDGGPTEEASKKGADIIFNLSASPFYPGKLEIRKNMIKEKAKKNNLNIIYTNLIGAQDGIVFEGGSFAVVETGKILAQAHSFKEDYILVPSHNKNGEITYDRIAGLFNAIVLGLRDYFRKNGFEKTVIGISGGIDSAIILAVAVYTFGKENVIGIMLPSEITSDENKNDAVKLLNNLGVKYFNIPISKLYEIYKNGLSPSTGKIEDTITGQNLQARIRGNILMAFSNSLNALVLATGNKSEIAMGYNTLYGDTVGAIAPIGDVYKTDVYLIGRYINKIMGNVIPENIFKKPPGAELKKDQKDEDDLPPYNILDKILRLIFEENKAVDEIVNAGYNKELVLDILKKIRKSEYKRNQLPPVIKVSEKSFGYGRRIPITNHFIK